MTIVLATRNNGKIEEMRAGLVDAGWTVRSCADFPGCPVVEETGVTFAENALLKARAVARFARHPALADDSGLEVDALGGAPGVHSARFSGPDATSASNNAALLGRLSGVPDAARTARFRCVIAVAAPNGRAWIVEGVCEGRVGTTPRGTAGFGYDPLFIPDGYTQTFAELDRTTKNQISHRGRAMRAVSALLRTLRRDLIRGQGSVKRREYMEENRYYTLADGTVFAVDPPLSLEIWSDRLHIIYYGESLERWDYQTVIKKLRERHGYLFKMRLSNDLTHEVRALTPDECSPEIQAHAETLNWPRTTFERSNV
ncbi:MAG: XTP/dITP diphosphatase [Candidatus Latescibacteria bacterium]|nr:XTP/dITP diphosphatase [Candidatus Latescibacterota bacterium]